ncbi:hypothetical protein ACFWWT_27480 [Streptomyces sp. NPDC058676]|uniref:hypothetical protein n=1 Tax=unclassified Streptomyces TaxID=2593676 RepID=UPI0036687F88
MPAEDGALAELSRPGPYLSPKACADLGADPPATLMVGDTPVRDGGATACGLRAYVFPAEQRIGDRGLSEVLGLVARRPRPATSRRCLVAAARWRQRRSGAAQRAGPPTEGGRPWQTPVP